ncbi:putative conjugal transfer protein [Vibrio nigripulchritudo SOn1]|uniref:Conjugal transfer protein n=1 Tax=Vibrio nigripulchritudo SOn1 TaxID=1238450 RepID=A0AAV2VHV6_9VIBR|nr:hypothetical protein [Vibrio nigripulchritudo]CCO44285.1 putative conjugal transfer protein [Vibrio nigripulchritudo SOn1]
MKKFFFSLLALSMPLTSSFASVSLPNCVYDAADKYGAPKKVFEALVIAERNSPNVKHSEHYGSMNLYKKAVPVASKGTGIEEQSIKVDDCSGYYAASWWLMNPAGGNTESDIWEAVYTYYYGKSERFRADPVKVEQVKKIFKTL